MQVIPTYINHSQSLILDWIYLIFLMMLERRERKPDLPYMLCAKQGSIWLYFENVFDITLSAAVGVKVITDLIINISKMCNIFLDV